MFETIIQLVGYAASVLLAISLLVNNDLKFRWLNTWGCLAFTIYGILIHAFPIILTNCILLLINAYHLVGIYSRNEHFDLLEFNTGDQLINKFLAFHHKDILHYFPDFNGINQSSTLHFVVLRDLVIANIFAAEVLEDGTALVKLNYTIPKYRDYKIGKFLFQKEKQLLAERGITRLVYNQVLNKQHQKYLEKMKFEKTSVNNQIYFHKNIS